MKYICILKQDIRNKYNITAVFTEANSREEAMKNVSTNWEVYNPIVEMCIPVDTNGWGNWGDKAKFIGNFWCNL